MEDNLFAFDKKNHENHIHQSISNKATPFASKQIHRMDTNLVEFQNKKRKYMENVDIMRDQESNIMDNSTECESSRSIELNSISLSKQSSISKKIIEKSFEERYKDETLEYFERREKIERYFILNFHENCHRFFEDGQIRYKVDLGSYQSLSSEYLSIYKYKETTIYPEFYEAVITLKPVHLSGNDRERDICLVINRKNFENKHLFSKILQELCILSRDMNENITNQDIDNTIDTQDKKMTYCQSCSKNLSKSLELINSSDSLLSLQSKSQCIYVKRKRISYKKGKYDLFNFIKLLSYDFKDWEQLLNTSIFKVKNFNKKTLMDNENTICIVHSSKELTSLRISDRTRVSRKKDKFEFLQIERKNISIFENFNLAKNYIKTSK